MAKPETVPVRFTADAHLISVLGEQLITSEQVGILELIKNAYDAGAQRCSVAIEKVPGMEPLQEPAAEVAALPGPVITIVDDGVGMDRNRIEAGWLRAATTIRTQVKDRLREERAKALHSGRLQALDAIVQELAEANDGRLPLGEKGIGRLATHRLGRYLWLRTKTRNDQFEWELRIDWDKFDHPEGGPAELSTVPLELRHQRQTFNYGPKNQGTVIRCYGGRPGFIWDERLIIDVARTVANLQSPRTQDSAFSVEFKQVYQLPKGERPIERVPPPIVVEADIKDSGLADISITFIAPTWLSKVVSDTESKREDEDLRDRADDNYWRTEGGFRRPSCGSFKMYLGIWNRDQKWLRLDRAEVAKYLENFGGVAVYRDGIAVVPADYVAHNDSLRLNVRGRKKGSKLTYYNMIGEIELSQKLNLDIIDQSSREGQLRNRQFRDLMELARAVVLVAEEYYDDVRSKVKNADVAKLRVPTVRQHARLAADVLATVATHYAFDEDEMRLLRVLRTEAWDKAPDVLKEISATLLRLDKYLGVINDQNKGLIEAAGFGLAISVALHELRKSVVSIYSLASKAVDSGAITPKQLETLKQQAATVESELRRIDPLRVTRLEKARVFNIREPIIAAVSAFRPRLNSAHIALKLPAVGTGFVVKARFGALAQVFANLIDNASYWLSTPSWSEHDKIIEVTCDPNSRTVTVSDSGPGLPDTVRDRLFLPFVTTKPEGQGLGLYICRFYLEQMKADIEDVRPRKSDRLSGARFVLDFAHVPEE